MTGAIARLRRGSIPLLVGSLLGFIGGFLTPILLATNQDNEAGLFGYIALLDLGVLALAYSKQWRALNYMAFSATVLMFGLAAVRARARGAWAGGWLATTLAAGTPF